MEKVALHHGELTDKAQAALGLETMWVDKGYDPHELEKCDAGLTQCDALVAQTGSVVMSNPSAGGEFSVFCHHTMSCWLAATNSCRTYLPPLS